MMGIPPNRASSIIPGSIALIILDLGIIVLIFKVKSSWELHNEKGGDSDVSNIKKIRENDETP